MGNMLDRHQQNQGNLQDQQKSNSAGISRVPQSIHGKRTYGTSTPPYSRPPHPTGGRKDALVRAPVTPEQRKNEGSQGIPRSK